MMRVVGAFAPLMAVALAGAAEAQAQTAPPKALTVDAAVTLTSDYRFRGISQSDRDPALQATVNVAHRSGVYVGIWTSTIGRYVVDGADPEIDLYGGWRKTLNGTAIDVGLLYYDYPGTRRAEGNSFEPYATLSHSLGPVTAKAGVNYAWKQDGIALDDGRRNSGLYGYGELSAAIPRTPVTITGHLGRSFHPTYATFGERYTDWSLQAAYVRKALTLSVAYVDTNKNIRSYPDGGRDRDVGGAGAIGSITIAF